jgi:hypothetical protein
VGSLRCTAAAAERPELLGQAPAQMLARLHLAATSLEPLSDNGSSADDSSIGRPRAGGVAAEDLVVLGPAPDGAELADRLEQLGALGRGGTEAPAGVLAAVVHGELLACRPFRHGNGLVARAAERAAITARGLDPTGVAVVEAGHRRAGASAYLSAASGYCSGTPAGVGAWLIRCAEALAAGAREGMALAEAVRP